MNAHSRLTDSEDGRWSALLEDLVLGNRSAKDPAVQEIFAKHPELLAEFRELEAMNHTLDQAGAEQHEDLSRVLAEDLDPKAVASAEALVAAHAPNAQGSTQAHRFRPWPVLGGLLAACLIAWLVLRGNDDKPATAPQDGAAVLGTEWAIRPIEGQTDWSLFQWDGTKCPEGAEVRVQVRNLNQPLDDLLVDTEPMLPGITQWQPTTNELKSFGTAIEWRIVLEPETVFRTSMSWVRLTR